MAIETTYSGARLWVHMTAAAGATETYELPSGYRHVAFTVHPGAGGTARLSTTCATPARVTAGTAPFVPIDLGDTDDVSEAAGAVLPSAVTAARLAATGAAAEAWIAFCT